MERRVALVAGATGLIGRRLAEHLRRCGWDVRGLCRRPAAGAAVRLIGVDLTDAADCRNRLHGQDDVTHVFYAARSDHPEGVNESVAINAAMLRNLVETLEPVAGGLRHIHAVHGTKYYGHHLGPLVVPVREEAARAPAPNFYYAQEDFLRERQRSKSWTFSTSRPHSFCEASWSEPRNIGLLIAVYAAIRRELGLPLAYPGTEKSFHVATQFTALELLARALAWMAEEPRCANQAYNIVNGDAPSWSRLWSRFASHFGMKAGPTEPMDLVGYMADKDALWQAIVRKHGLRPTALHSLVLWPYGNYVFRPEWDIISDTSKVRRHGFAEAVDSGRMFLDIFDHLRAERIVP
jgi:nucleoside-diphosphate-sugar epimerase